MSFPCTLSSLLDRSERREAFPLPFSTYDKQKGDFCFNQAIKAQVATDKGNGEKKVFIERAGLYKRFTFWVRKTFGGAQGQSRNNEAIRSVIQRALKEKYGQKLNGAGAYDGGRTPKDYQRHEHGRDAVFSEALTEGERGKPLYFRNLRTVIVRANAVCEQGGKAAATESPLPPSLGGQNEVEKQCLTLLREIRVSPEERADAQRHIVSLPVPQKQIFLQHFQQAQAVFERQQEQQQGVVLFSEKLTPAVLKEILSRTLQGVTPDEKWLAHFELPGTDSHDVQETSPLPQKDTPAFVASASGESRIKEFELPGTDSHDVQETSPLPQKDTPAFVASASGESRMKEFEMLIGRIKSGETEDILREQFGQEHEDLFPSFLKKENLAFAMKYMASAIREMVRTGASSSQEPEHQMKEILKQGFIKSLNEQNRPPSSPLAETEKLLGNLVSEERLGSFLKEQFGGDSSSLIPSLMEKERVVFATDYTKRKIKEFALKDKTFSVEVSETRVKELLKKGFIKSSEKGITKVQQENAFRHLRQKAGRLLHTGSSVHPVALTAEQKRRKVHNHDLFQQVLKTWGLVNEELQEELGDYKGRFQRTARQAAEDAVARFIEENADTRFLTREEMQELYKTMLHNAIAQGTPEDKRF